jgi:hypothetical protein
VNRRRCPGTAFTLVELLAASALAAVLMVVLFQVIVSLGRSRAALAAAAGDGRTGPHAAWKADLLDTLRRDLANATEVRVGRDEVEITGHGSLDRQTLAAAHEPVTVVYGLVGPAGRASLVRRQSPRGGVTNDRAWSELVCANVSRFSLEPVSTARIAIVRPDPLTTPLRLRIASETETLLDEVIVAR